MQASQSSKYSESDNQDRIQVRILPVGSSYWLRDGQSGQGTNSCQQIREKYGLRVSQSGQNTSEGSTTQSKLLAKRQPGRASYRVEINQSGQGQAWSQPIRTKYSLGVSQSRQLQAGTQPFRAKHRLQVCQSEESTTLTSASPVKAQAQQSTNQSRLLPKSQPIRARYHIEVIHQGQVSSFKPANERKVQARSQPAEQCTSQQSAMRANQWLSPNQARQGTVSKSASQGEAQAWILPTRKKHQLGVSQ